MKVTKGLWTISEGKGNRRYIKGAYDESETGVGLLHPEQLSGLNGCGMYGHLTLMDLADAIYEFDKKMKEKPLVIPWGIIEPKWVYAQLYTARREIVLNTDYDEKGNYCQAHLPLDVVNLDIEGVPDGAECHRPNTYEDY